MKKPVVALAFLLFVNSGHLWAHSVAYKVGRGGITITVWYEGIKPIPMKGAFVRVFAPEEDTEFQKGRTDRNGRFSFYPDRPGKWQVVINDGNGHGIVADVEVGKDFRTSSPMRIPFPFALKLLVGLSIIFGIFGVLSLWKNRELNRR